MKSILLLILTLMIAPETPAMAPTRFNSDWKFSRGDFAGAEVENFNDSGWQQVDLPHDWSIAGPIAADNPTGSPGGFFPARVGWYRKTFTPPATIAGKQVTVRFDGVYMLSDVWVNGKKLGSHVYGYTPFSFDVTPHLKPGQSNIIAVRVDNSRQMNSRWYSGSGIYRHVWLETRDRLHVQPNGISIATTRATKETATLQLRITAENSSDLSQPSCEVSTRILALDAEDGKSPVVIAEAGPLQFSKWQRKSTQSELATAESEITIRNPQLWSPENPSRYVAITTLSLNGRVVDQVETTFGIRTIEVSAAKGFLLNGEKVILYGGNVHHDHGALGAAAFDRAEERRAELLKAAGFNAVRTSHYPPAPAFLDACDRLGLLVIDELFDCWRMGKNDKDYHLDFDQHWQEDMEATVLRDRNHPSVIMWSLGNEIHDFGSPQGLQTGRMLLDHIRSLDQTRFTTTSVFWFPTIGGKLHWEWREADELMNLFDVVGYNYQIPRYAEDHKLFPDRVIVSAESFPRDLFECWAAAADNNWILGDFVWSAIDYLGESGIGRYWLPDEHILFHGEPGQFPYHGATCGDIDITGFRKPVSYARNITWDRGEKLYTSVTEPTPDGRPIRVADWGVIPSRASWTWPGYEGKPLEVQVYSRCESMQLYLNDTLIGEKPTSRAQRFKAVFNVPYAAGTLKTVGLVQGKPVVTSTLMTAGPVAGLRITADRTTISADGQDLSFVTIESVDALGDFQPTGDQGVSLSINGPGTIAGVASADMSRARSYQSDRVQLFQGRAQAIIRSGKQPGRIELEARSGEFPSTKLIVERR